MSAFGEDSAHSLSHTAQPLSLPFCRLPMGLSKHAPSARTHRALGFATRFGGSATPPAFGACPSRPGLAHSLHLPTACSLGRSFVGCMFPRLFAAPVNPMRPSHRTMVCLYVHVQVEWSIRDEALPG
mmetsp:Transcript_77407/g.129167  ORF Transcript_77407/g.129167 Transcript_77407/m.129167 type:complete len:127 (-) Transcript_77407:180-560(-)